MKKLKLIIIFALFCGAVFGQLDTTNVGTSANSGTGEGLRSAFLKVNRAILQVNTNTTDIATLEADTVVGSSLYPELADTIPLVTFGAGTGLIADTALMNNGVLIGSFYNEGSDTLAITQLVGILKEGTGTETIAVQISWHATFLSGSATNLNAAALAITSLTTGTVDTSFANAKIPPNVFVWGILSGASASNKPTFLSVTLSGYKIPTY